MRLRASAPGKLVVIGEYAVLFGHPAVVVAVDRRAVVTVDSESDELWTVSAAGYASGSARFAVDAEGGFAWRTDDSDVTERFLLVEQVVRGLLAAGELDAAGMRCARLAVDTSGFFVESAAGPAKIGLGSSAAATVALAEALYSWAPPASAPERISLDRLLELHRGFQGGRGSGIDLAAAAVGGVVGYRLADGARVPVAEPMSLPPELQMTFVWTGRSASTAAFLARLEASLKDGRNDVDRVLAEMGGQSASASACLCGGDAAGFVAAADTYGDMMSRLGDAAAVPVLSPEHERLRELARQVGVAYKPSGAGGGDVGIAFSDDGERSAAFRARAEDAGFVVLDVGVDPTGVVCRRLGDAAGGYGSGGSRGESC